MAAKMTKKSVGRTSVPRDQWTSMYIPKDTVPQMIDELTELVLRDLPPGTQIPRYSVLEMALREAIESRKSRTKR